MAKRALVVVVSVLLVLILLLPACKTTTVTTSVTSTKTSTATTTVTQTTSGTTTTGTTTSTTSTTTTTTPAKPWWEEQWGTPNYGGTLTLRAEALSSFPMDPGTFDTFRNSGYMAWYEAPFGYSSTVPREEWPYSGDFVPATYAPGLLVESWEQPDPLTVNCKLREGILWQYKEPMNGRELVAADIEWHFDRLFGNGSGFTEPSPILSGFMDLIEDVKATGKYTFTYTFTKPSYASIIEMVSVNPAQFIEPRESVEKYGNLNDWHNAVGTGPWILENFVQDSEIIYVKNDNYWGFDERYPENQLPYFDEVDIIQIADDASALAAMRSGQIDIIYEAELTTRDDLAQSNPDIQSVGTWRQGYSLTLRNDMEPFTDIRVRQALDMAINRPEIAQVHYKGTLDWYPHATASPAYPGWFTPFDEWSQDLKDQYIYNPEGARALLAAAGLEDGFDTNVVASTTMDLDLLQIIQANFAEIGVNMEIIPMEFGAFDAYTNSMQHDQMAYTEESGVPFPPTASVLNRHSTMSPGNISANDDPIYDEMSESFFDAVTEAEAQEIFKEVELYTLSKHWDIYVFPKKLYTLWQPSLKGFSGEILSFMQGWNWARMWK